MKLKLDSPFGIEKEVMVYFTDEELDLFLIYYEDGSVVVEQDNNIDWHKWR